MYCRKCGVRHPDDAKFRFCVNCGENLGSEEAYQNKISGENIPPQEIVDLSIVRKAIKAKARSSSKSPLVITLVLMFLLVLLGNIVSGVNVIVGIIYILLVILLLFVQFGMVKTSLNISRGEHVKFMNVIENSFKNPSWFFKNLLVSSVFFLILLVLAIIPYVGAIIVFAAEIYFIPVLMIYMYRAADPKTEDKSIFGMARSSAELIKGHRVEFYGLMISFFGGFLVGDITLGIVLFWIMPYIIVSLANFYRYLNKEEKYIEAEKGLSNGAIIGLGIFGSIVITIVVCFVVYFAVYSFYGAFDFGIISQNDSADNDTLEEYQDYYDSDENDNSSDANINSFNIVNMGGINVAIPVDYLEYTVSDFDNAYISGDGNVLIATKVISDVTGTDLDTYSEVVKNILSSVYTCDDIDSKYLNGQKWNEITCDYGAVILYTYITFDNDNVYVLAVSDESASNIVDIVENNLSLAS